MIPAVLFCSGRGDKTRTCDPMLPKHVRYQLRYTSIANEIITQVGAAAGELFNDLDPVDERNVEGLGPCSADDAEDRYESQHTVSSEI